MKADVDLTPAPKRGRYDRALSRPARQAAQRERVVAAITALASAQRPLNVANVVELAGIGRNTFYEYFDDIEHALLAIQQRALREFSERVEPALQAARTPIERVRALARAWTQYLHDVPAMAQVALRAQPEDSEPTQLSVLARQLVKLLSAEVEAHATLPGLREPLNVLVVAALFDAVSRSHFVVQRLTADELQRALSDLTLRLLR